jgi:phosphatidylinositol kinase/protein kinase (PI-3  family)
MEPWLRAGQVVPFSPAAGLLQWVEDTIPMGEYLTGRDRCTGAQERYRAPGDVGYLEAFQLLEKAKHKNLRHAFDKVRQAHTARIPAVKTLHVTLCALQRVLEC